MLVVIDYLMGNLGSITNMLKKIGAKVTISSSPADIEQADKLILPGVGTFDCGMKKLHELGLVPVLKHKVIENKTPILGICLGMQLFSKRSGEGKMPGLGWLDAETIRFKFADAQFVPKVPHMGWNTVSIMRRSSLFDNMYAESRFYFLHSYHVVCNDDADILTKTHHGYDFVSSIMRGNISGVQFHPEKSHKFGMRLLENFVHSS